jgi:hypothetical protein
MKTASSTLVSRSAGIETNAPATIIRRSITKLVGSPTGFSTIRRGLALRRFGAVKMGKDGCGY